MTSAERLRPVVVLLAGGLSSRMGGGDKGLRPFRGSTVLDHVVRRVRSQGSRLVLNANGDPQRFARFGLPVLPDTVPGNPGPLAGVLAGLEWARDNAPDVEDVVTVPTDAPFLPHDLVDRLIEARQAAHAEIACAGSGGRTHPVIALWPRRLAWPLRRALLEEGIRKIDRWTARYKVAVAAFATEPLDPFFNVNEPAELAAAERLAEEHPAAAR